MAENVNLREQEYNEVTSELQKFHTEQIEAITDILGKLKTLATSADGLSADKTSAKISDVAETVTSDVLALMGRAFDDSEAGVSDMITAILATDTACG